MTTLETRTIFLPLAPCSNQAMAAFVNSFCSATAANAIDITAAQRPPTCLTFLTDRRMRLGRVALAAAMKTVSLCVCVSHIHLSYSKPRLLSVS